MLAERGSIDAFRATFVEASFVEADLSYANLKRAALEDANFRYARLDYACIEQAHISGSKFYGASLIGITGFESAFFEWIDIGSNDAPVILQHDAAVEWFIEQSVRK